MTAARRPFSIAALTMSGSGLLCFDVGRCGVPSTNSFGVEQLDLALGLLHFGGAGEDHGMTGPFEVA